MNNVIHDACQFFMHQYKDAFESKDEKKAVQSAYFDQSLCEHNLSLSKERIDRRDLLEKYESVKEAAKHHFNLYCAHMNSAADAKRDKEIKDYKRLAMHELQQFKQWNKSADNFINQIKNLKND